MISDQSPISIQKEGKAPNCVFANLMETCQSEEEYIDISSVSATGYAGELLIGLFSPFIYMTI